MKNQILTLFIFLLALQITGCAGIAKKWKSLVGGSTENEAKLTEDGKPIPPTTFNSNPNYGSYKERQYKKVTAQNFDDDQNLQENAGSLWRKEGQGSYLFSQNSLRVIGDIINVELEGKAAENLNIKVDLIKKAQAKLDIPKPKQGAKATKIPNPADTKSDERSTASVPAPVPQPEGAAETLPVVENADGKSSAEGMKFDLVPCRITEKNADGSYRVKGLQVVFIGKKEFKLLVTGSVRPDDISTETVSSSRIIDSKYDLLAKDGSR